VRVHESALKHGVADGDMLAAVSDMRLTIAVDDESPQRQPALGVDTSTRLLEVVRSCSMTGESRWSSTPRRTPQVP
jgi:acyl-coenzyme A thioesterase PaaI-like protein